MIYLILAGWLSLARTFLSLLDTVTSRQQIWEEEEEEGNYYLLPDMFSPFPPPFSIPARDTNQLASSLPVAASDLRLAGRLVTHFCFQLSSSLWLTIENPKETK